MTEHLVEGEAPAADPSGRRLIDVGVAGMLVAAMTGLVLAGAPVPVRLAALLLAAGAVGLALWRRSTLGDWEMAATATGVLLAVLIVAGVLLDRLPGGIGRPGWALTAGLLGWVTLAGVAAWPVRRAVPRPRLGLTAVAALVAASVVALALGIAVAGSQSTDVPPTQMWLDTSADGGEVVALRAPGPAGPFDLWLEPQDGAPVLITSGLTLDGEQLTTVPLPEVTVRTSVVLRSPSSGDAVRSLVVEAG